MKTSSAVLIDDLIQSTKTILNQVEELKTMEKEKLNWKSDPKTWSILECLEHLNRYGDFYLPEIEEQIGKAKDSGPVELFKSGLLGNYFAKSMLPKEKLNKMNTFKSMNPIGSNLDKTTIEKMIRQQKKMLDLLDKARAVNLQKVKTGISISSWIKLRLGDTFRVVIYHNQRHLVQVERVIENWKNR